MQGLFEALRWILQHITEIFEYMIQLFMLMFDTVTVSRGLFSFIPPVVSSLLFLGLTIVIIAHLIHWEN